MENIKKVFTIIYALAIASLMTVLLMSIYNLTFAYSGVSTPRDIETIFTIANIVTLSCSALLLISIVINAFTKDKFFWLEIAFSFLSIGAVITMLALSSKHLSVSAFQMVMFESISTFALLLLSRLCIKFNKTKEVKHEENA